jgi:hypothetical protein
LGAVSGLRGSFRSVRGLCPVNGFLTNTLGLNRFAGQSGQYYGIKPLFHREGGFVPFQSCADGRRESLSARFQCGAVAAWSAAVNNSRRVI